MLNGVFIGVRKYKGVLNVFFSLVRGIFGVRSFIHSSRL